MQELYVDSVAHRYGERTILSSVYLNCQIGEVIGLLGRNGSGKSTLLKIIFGSIRPDYIYMKLNGQPVKRAYLTGQLAYLPQSYFVPAHLKIKQLVELYTNKYKADLLTQEVISTNLNRPIGNLSGGQRRVVECLLVLYSDSDFVLLDEPFSQLAPLIIEEMQMHILKFKSQKGIILTDHYYRQILSTSTRIVLLHNGCNYKINTIEDLQLHGYINSQ
ncbi:MAG: ATP-binding cassette domain-containing protein [Candidatus Pedobacter colombiensis]|uniref:ATP-binding cassette domain-containing protein n=1 Tax=Candidatus Pedobacter colombiensis TaxID=3121371 RepID=A0AAJ5W3L5_9SPHI|nr:ATP-binding cassette domain-containing protein [Pedobacter sp.]WEK17439.1 MAG: ATP-binding cassette domain-containing protein [Pedobacter sp.]